MDSRHNGSSGSGFNLFFFGILIGVIITLLLTTKKGRRILEILIDEGVEKMSKWEDVMAVIEKNSKKILDNAEDVTERVEEKAVEAQVISEEVKDDVQERVDKVLMEVEQKKEALRKEVQEKVEELTREAEQIKKEAAEIVQEIEQNAVIPDENSDDIISVGDNVEEHKVEKIELKPEPQVEKEKKTGTKAKSKEEKESDEKPKSTGRRFFRGIGRKK